MAKSKTGAPAAIPQPTFSTFEREYWDEEKDRPEPVTPYDLEDSDVLSATREVRQQWLEWRRIQSDPDEAPARQAYAEHVARHLTGIYPNLRISADAYAAAAGEELGRFSADIVRGVAQHARRTSKNFPSIAQLVEWAGAEERRREAYGWAHSRALDDHAAAIARGRAEATRIAEQAAAAALAPAMDGAAILQLHEVLTWHPMGIESPYSSWKWQVARALFRRLAQGDCAAAAQAAELLEAGRQHDAQWASAADDEERRAIWSEYAERLSARMGALGEALGLPRPGNEIG